MIIFLILILLASPAQAQAHAQEQMYVYKALRIIDGDTIAINIQKESPLIQKLGLNVRIKGIDAPERGSKAKCEKEKIKAEEAQKFVNELVGVIGEKELLLSEVKNDRYGNRIVANVKVGGVDIAKALLNRGLAVPYTGEGPKHNWCK